MTIYVLVSEDASQVLTNLDDGKYMAWESREEAEAVRENFGDEYGRLRVESREVEDDAPVAREKNG